MQQLHCRLPVGSFVDTGNAYVRILQQVEDQARAAMCLGHFHNARVIQLFAKQPHYVRRREEDAEAILDPYMPPPPPPRTNVVISGVQDEAWGLLEMAVSSAWG